MFPRCGTKRATIPPPAAAFFMKKILFFAPFGQWAVHHQLDAVLAAALRVRGCEVAVAGCDGVFKTCDLLAWVGAQAPHVCHGCAANSKSLFGRFGLPLLQLRSYLTPNDFEEATEWSTCLDVTSYATATHEGKPIGEWATSSVCSHFRITEASLHLPEVRKVHQGYLVTALLTWIALSRMLDRFEADAMAIFNGRMAPYRVAFEVARERGIRVLGHERGVTPGTFTLYENTSCREPRPIYDYIERWRHVPLNAGDCARCAAITNRQSGTNMNFPGFYDYRTEGAEVRRGLGIPRDARILGVFTSSEFELANNSFYQPEIGQLEFIDRLIEVFRGRTDYLVVRHHPNIAGDATLAADRDFLRRAWRQAQRAPGNVRIIMPSEKLSSYGLMPHLDGAIAFFSSTGIECIARGVAGAALPQSYCHPAATFLIQDISQQGLAHLVDLLFAKTRAFQPSDLRSVYRYVSASLSRHSSKFDTFQMKNFFEADIRVQDADDLAPGRDRLLDRVCEFLTIGAPLFDAPGAEERQRSTEEEDAFFEAQWGQISAVRRQQIAERAAEPEFPVQEPVAIINMGGAMELPAWCARSRHRALVPCASVATAGRPWTEVLASVKLSLAKVTENYVLLSGEGFEYDESFIGSAVSTLEANAALAGVAIGGWVTQADGRIDAELFTQRRPCREFLDACCMLNAFHEPHVGLSFVLFRTRRLIELLEALPPGLTREETAGRLFDALREPAFEQRLLPMAMIQGDPLRAVEVVDTQRDTPTLLLIFNRPDLTQQVFEAIRSQRPTRLFVAADGPRPHLPAERARCEAARRRVLDHVDWDCEVQTLLRDENLGCKRAVSSAITWFFDHVEEGIILEDDCLPGPDFFRFCGQMLAHYRDTSQVMQIGGVNFQQGRKRGEASFYFSKYAHIWGWATWRRAWRHYEAEMAGLEDFLSSEAWRKLCPDPRESAYWEPILRRVRDGQVDTWDYQWNYTLWKHGGMSALPQVNLVSNLGFRDDATHTTQTGARMAHMKIRALGRLVFDGAGVIDREADRLTFDTVFSPVRKSKSADPNANAKKAGKQRARLKRIAGDLTAMKDSLAWKLIGKPFFSIEKRVRRLLVRKGDNGAPTQPV